MLRHAKPTAMMLTLMFPLLGWASEAETSATAASNRFGDGSAAATAHYAGDLGFARTDTRSGQVNLARGVAVGVDESGISLSVSHAIALPFGPAVASTFNVSIDRDGRTAHSTGTAVSEGRRYRSATAGGAVSTGRHGHNARAIASGETDRRGKVRAVTNSHTSRARRMPLTKRRAPSELRRYRLVRR